MCGVLNVINKKKKQLDLPACRRALHCLTLRGPDLCSYETWNDQVFLGQTILSITGNIDQNDEHLHSKSRRFKLCVNGEIYNYKELSSKYLSKEGYDFSQGRTDAEVLVNLHEVMPVENVSKTLDGMYAYSVIDKQAKTLTICRDVQGEKLLYVYEDEQMIIISSEIQPILLLVPSLKPDPQVLRDYFHTRHFMFLERTLYPGIRQLLPGHMQTIDLNTMQWKKDNCNKLSDWIDPEKMKKNENKSIDVLADELDVLMRKTAKEMIPERNFAAVVSGGVDSSLVAYYLAQYRDPNLFVAVNHVGKDNISCDLEGFEKVLKKKISVIDMDKLVYSREISRCQKICSSPLFSHSFVGQSVQSDFVRAKGCCVMFGGDGADELLGGYKCYLDQRKISKDFSPSFYSRFQSSPLEFEEDDPVQLKDSLKKSWKESLQAYGFIENEKDRCLQAMMYCDFSLQLPSVGMRGTDLMSLMWNVEARNLFIRRPIVEFALNLPGWAKSDNRETIEPIMRAKPLLKKLFLRYFPKEILYEKQGFAGFPNESGVYLGDVNDFLALDLLKVKEKNINNGQLDRDTLWKLINIEYFLRETM